MDEQKLAQFLHKSRLAEEFADDMTLEECARYALEDRRFDLASILRDLTNFVQQETSPEDVMKIFPKGDFGVLRRAAHDPTYEWENRYLRRMIETLGRIAAGRPAPPR